MGRLLDPTESLGHSRSRAAPTVLWTNTKNKVSSCCFVPARGWKTGRRCQGSAEPLALWPAMLLPGFQHDHCSKNPPTLRTPNVTVGLFVWHRPLSKVQVAGDCRGEETAKKFEKLQIWWHTHWVSIFFFFFYKSTPNHVAIYEKGEKNGKNVFKAWETFLERKLSFVLPAMIEKREY